MKATSPSFTEPSLDRSRFEADTCCMFKGPTICPKCGREMEMALPPNGGKGQRFSQCFNCDRPDPMKSGNAQAWLNGELARE